MTHYDFYKYKIIGLPIIISKKLYMNIEFLNHFYFFSLMLKNKKILKEGLYNSFNKLKLNLCYLDYFNLFSSEINQCFSINRSNTLGHFPIFYFRFFIHNQKWNIRLLEDSWYFTLLLSYNNLNKNYFFSFNFFEIKQYFKQFFLFLEILFFDKIKYKLLEYIKNKIYYKNRFFFYNQFKISLQYLKTFINLDLYTLKYLLLFKLITRWSYNRELFDRIIWKDTLCYIAKKQIRKRFSRFLSVKKFILSSCRNNYISKYSIIYRHYKKKIYLKFFSRFFLLFKKFYLFYKKLFWNKTSFNYTKHFEIIYFDIIKYIMKIYKLFILKKITFKRYYRKFFYSFFFKIWINFKLFKFLDEKKTYKFFFIKIKRKIKFNFFIQLFNIYIQYIIYVKIKQEIKNYDLYTLYIYDKKMKSLTALYNSYFQMTYFYALKKKSISKFFWIKKDCKWFKILYSFIARRRKNLLIFYLLIKLIWYINFVSYSIKFYFKKVYSLWLFKLKKKDIVFSNVLKKYINLGKNLYKEKNKFGNFTYLLYFFLGLKYLNRKTKFYFYYWLFLELWKNYLKTFFRFYFKKLKKKKKK